MCCGVCVYVRVCVRVIMWCVCTFVCMCVRASVFVSVCERVCVYTDLSYDNVLNPDVQLNAMNLQAGHDQVHLFHQERPFLCGCHLFLQSLQHQITHHYHSTAAPKLRSIVTSQLTFMYTDRDNNNLQTILEAT